MHYSHWLLCEVPSVCLSRSAFNPSNLMSSAQDDTWLNCVDFQMAYVTGDLRRKIRGTRVEKGVLILWFALSWWISLGWPVSLLRMSLRLSASLLCVSFFLRTPVISGVSSSVFMPLIYCTILQVLLHCTYTLLNCLQINPLQFFRNL